MDWFGAYSIPSAATCSSASPRDTTWSRWTKPYYRTGYVIAYQKDRLEEVRSLDDPRLKTLRVGVQVNTPPHVALARRGIVGSNVVGYQLMYDSNAHPEDYPGKQVEDLIAGRIDVALVWGPIAGYFQKKKGAASLAVVPIEDAQDGAAFDISMGVRKADTELKARLEQVIDRKRDEIRAILQDFGVPLIPFGNVSSQAGRRQRPTAAMASARVVHDSDLFDRRGAGFLISGARRGRRARR